MAKPGKEKNGFNTCLYTTEVGKGQNRPVRPQRSGRRAKTEAQKLPGPAAVLPSFAASAARAPQRLPEARAMVGFPQMNQLVHDDVIRQPHRQLEQSPVENFDKVVFPLDRLIHGLRSGISSYG